MKNKPAPHLMARLLPLAFAMNLYAGPRTSTNYTVATDTADAGGQRATSASYTNSGSAGGVAGVSSVAAPAETAKHGYISQLYDVTGLTLTAAAPAVNETATVQLNAWQSLDDLSVLAVPGTGVAWSVLSGPVAGISSAGLATAGIVYQNTAAVVQGSFGGFTGSLGLTVLDSIADNFGTYAGDGLGDDWQVQYFGQNNPNAAPLLDPDRDGFDNRFEYAAGLIPTDPLSVFHWRIEPVPGQTAQTRIIFSPRLAGRTYTVQTSTSLLDASWISLNGTTTDNGTERTVTDPDSTGARKFYRVDIAPP